jgi:conjugal transfer pilin signal peptidase TrbI
MKGHVFISLIILLTVLPIVALLLRVNGTRFLKMTAVVSVACFCALVASLAMGIRITENLTSSLKGHVYIYVLGKNVSKGDLMAFSWHGGATYPRGSIFIKEVIGVPGDTVVRKDREIWVGDHYVGVAKPKTKAGIPVEPAAGGVIPADAFFVATPSKDSMDSRYAIVGNITKREMLGRAYELF